MPVGDGHNPNQPEVSLLSFPPVQQGVRVRHIPLHPPAALTLPLVPVPLLTPSIFPSVPFSSLP